LENYGKLEFLTKIEKQAFVSTRIGVRHIFGDMMDHPRPAPVTSCYSFSLAPNPETMHYLRGDDRAVIFRAEGDHALLT